LAAEIGAPAVEVAGCRDIEVAAAIGDAVARLEVGAEP
jgi:hypothetical protein